MEKYNFNILDNSNNDKLIELDKLLKENKINLDEYFGRYKKIKNSGFFEEAIDVPLKKAELEINDKVKNLNIKSIDFDTYTANVNTFFEEKKTNIKDEIYNLQLEYLNGNLDFETFSKKYKKLLNENIEIVG